MKKELKKKILLDIRLLVICVPAIIAGWFSSPIIDEPVWNINPFLSGICSAAALMISVYLFASWVFYDYFYKK